MMTKPCTDFDKMHSAADQPFDRSAQYESYRAEQRRGAFEWRVVGPNGETIEIFQKKRDAECFARNMQQRRETAASARLRHEATRARPEAKRHDACMQEEPICEMTIGIAGAMLVGGRWTQIGRKPPAEMGTRTLWIGENGEQLWLDPGADYPTSGVLLDLYTIEEPDEPATR